MKDALDSIIDDLVKNTYKRVDVNLDKSWQQERNEERARAFLLRAQQKPVDRRRPRVVGCPT